MNGSTGELSVDDSAFATSSAGFSDDFSPPTTSGTPTGTALSIDDELDVPDFLKP